MIAIDMSSDVVGVCLLFVLFTSFVVGNPTWNFSMNALLNSLV